MRSRRLMVSRFGHCLNDLLFRARTGALPVEIAGVVSNHTDFAELVGFVPTSPSTTFR
ncbi:Formyltetrahydrofolate deformylase [Streptomyces hirsutus]